MLARRVARRHQSNAFPKVVEFVQDVVRAAITILTAPTEAEVSAVLALLGLSAGNHKLSQSSCKVAERAISVGV